LKKSFLPKFDDGSAEWTPAVDFTIIDDGTSSANWTGGPSVTVTQRSLGSRGGFAALIPTDFNQLGFTGASAAIGDILVTIAGFGLTDTRNMTLLGLHWIYTAGVPADIGTNLSLTVEFYDAVPALLATANFTIDSRTKGEIVYIDIPPAARVVNLDQLVVKFNEAFTATGSHVFECVATIVTDGLEATATFWDTTSIIDDAEGTTIVAAASSPPNADDAETDGGNRELKYLQTSSSDFKTLQLVRRVDVVNEVMTTVPANTSSSTTTDTLAAAALSGFNSIIKGTFNLSTDEDGTFATTTPVEVTSGTETRNLIVEVLVGEENLDPSASYLVLDDSADLTDGDISTP